MSFNISTPAAQSVDALSASAVAIDTTAWRAVEAQHRVSTMKLVDSVAEQAVLERLIDATKPVIPDACAHLHYLLATPLRYGPSNPYPSRFRPPGAPGVFYAACVPEAAMAEIAFYRLLFFAESPGTPIPTNAAEYTAFAVQVRASKALDLTRPPFSDMKDSWGATQDYGACQRLAMLAREAGIEMVAYASVRDPRHRMNYALLTPSAFGREAPVAYQTWRLLLRRDGVVAKCEAPEIGLRFSIADFAADERLRRP